MERGGGLTRRSVLTFHWAIAIAGAVHEDVVRVRADHAHARGVRTPAHWGTAIRCGDLQKRAADTARKLDPDGTAQLHCVFAGVPKACPPPDDALATGSVVHLRTSAGRTNFLLVAWVSGSVWYCHSGSFSSDLQGEASGRLDEGGLCTKDIQSDAWEEPDRPAKRIKAHARSAQLRDLREGSVEAWDRLVAIATCMAEWKRAEVQSSNSL